MGDFLLDFRTAEARRPAAAMAASLLKWCDDTEVKTIDHPLFSLVLTRVDGFDLWGPAESSTSAGNLLVALAGRVAFEEAEWQTARTSQSTGGFACRAILERYRHGGLPALESLNGNFVAFVHDQPAGKFHILTDRCGMFLAYYKTPLETASVFGSHPDVLSSILGEGQRLDLASLTEFVTAGHLTFPYTYYRNIRGLDTGCACTLSRCNGSLVFQSKRQYFHLDFNLSTDRSEESLAEELANSFRSAVVKRTFPLFGDTGVGLSGGLDSRAILSASRANNHDSVRAFTLFDEENTESRTAHDLANACGVELIPLQRDFEYYGNSADLGVRISGATGNIASNHFLGVRDHLRRLGIRNVVTGCYCDYVLKGLAFNTCERTLSRVEQLTGFKFEYYHHHFPAETPLAKEVLARWETLFPESRQPQLSEQDWCNIQRKRTFPLAYEGDLAQRVIPQRILPWFPIIVDNALIDTYLKIRPSYKLNSSVFRKMLRLLCNERVCRIPDSNTGARLDASRWNYSFHRYFSALCNRIDGKFSPHIASRGSWPNWEFYIRHSHTIQSLWTRRNETASRLLTEVLGTDPFRQSPIEFRNGKIELFLRLFTLKLWLDQRAGIAANQ